MLDFVDRHSLSFPQVDDRPGEIFNRFGVPYQPAWVFLGADGKVIRIQGSLAGNEIADYVAEIA